MASADRPAPPSVPRRVLVTGASGFIGRALCSRYSELGAEVVGVDLVANPDRAVVAGDVSAAGPWQDAARGCDLVVHTAAVVSMRSQGADRIWAVNALGTRNVVEAAARAGVSRLLHLSSVAAFGFDFPDGVDERFPVRANGVPYVDTKIVSEHVVMSAHGAGEVPATVLRPGDVYGPGSRPWTILPVEMMRAGRFVLPGGGRGVFSHVYVDNLVDGAVLAAGTPDAAGRVVTVTDGVGPTASDFFGHYARMLGRPLRTLPRSATLAVTAAASAAARAVRRTTELNPASARYLCRRGTYSIDLARGLLGYRPRVGLEEGMDRCEAWLRAVGRIP